MGQRYEKILGTIGNTPGVKINRSAPANVNLFFKIEAFNPLGPVKDRRVLGVIEEAEKSGALQPGHPAFKPHPMQGWSPDFVPKITGDVIDMNVIDKLITIAGPNAMKCARELATKEGIFVGISAGATLAGGLEICQEAADGANILCMPPDTGERYLSTPVFAEIETDMNDKEREISRSTPGFYLQAAG